MHEVGRVIGDYRLESLLGKGGFGEVWKAWDAKLSRWVALKLLRQDGPDELKRFLREAQTAASLAHPNIAAVYQVGSDAGRQFIAMQLIDGQTLHAEPRGDLARVARMMRDVAHAVAYAHERGVIHRDLKPGNIMVDRDGRPFVLDFGLARELRAGSSLTVSGMLIGTPAYMSPEQAQGRPADARSDVYSLGATLYEVLTHRPPFSSDDILSLLAKVATADPVPPRASVPGLPRDLDTIVMKCLEKQPERRYPSAGALAEDLTRWLHGEPILAHPPSSWYLLRKRIVKRKALLVSASLTLALAIVVAIILPRWLAARAEVRAQEQKRRELELYVSLEARLNELRMKLYWPRYTLADEFARYEALIKDIEAQMASSGPGARGHYLIGRCHEVLAAVADADRQYARALQLDPAHAPSLLARGRLQIERALMKRSLSQSQPGGERTILLEARAAADGIRQACKSGTPSIDADLAQAHVEIIETWGRPYSTATWRDKWRAEPYVQLFLLLEGIALGGPALVERATQVIEQMRSLPAAYLWRGIARKAGGDAAGAFTDYTEALRINPRYAEAYVARGWLRFENGDPTGATADLGEALRLNAGLWEAFYNRAIARAAIGDLNGAIADYSEAIRLCPGHWEAYGNRANARQARDDADGAIADYTEALRINPNDAASHYNRGNARKHKGETDSAISDYTEAIRLRPDYAKAYVNRGLIRLDRNDLDGATTDFDEALRIDPRLPEAHANRGRALLARGDVAGATAALQKALDIAPPNWPLRSSVQAALDELKRR